MYQHRPEFFMIPAGDVMTGKTVNTLDDILAAYADDTDMVVYVLRVEGRSRPVFLTSYGADTDTVLGHIVGIEHTQTGTIFRGKVLNIVHMDNGKVSHAAFDVAINDGAKGAHWVMK